MRVLHVWDIGGTGGHLVQYMRQDCIHRRVHDPYRQTTMYSESYLVGVNMERRVRIGAGIHFIMRAA